MKTCFSYLLLLMMSAACCEIADAAVTRIEILQKLPYAEGRKFDGVGKYERLLGRVHFAVDPKAAANKRIIDLEHAPQNKQGLVEFSADLEILAPVDRAKATGTLLYDVNNRGRRMVLRMFNGEADHFLMRRGIVVVWCGWIAEVLPIPDENKPSDNLLRMDAPFATRNGKTIAAMIRAEMVPDEPVTRMNITNRTTMGSHRPTKSGLHKATLTYRLREKDSRQTIPRDQWKLQTHESIYPGHKRCFPVVELVLKSGFKPGHIYELIYEAQDPVAQGLGLAGIRDLVSFLKYDTTEKNPLRTAGGKSAIKQTLGFGVSQSGRCLRMLTYQGFNADEQGRQVFDGLIPHVSGGGLGFFNYHFASPTRYASQHTNHLFPCDMFPFAYGTQRDPNTGREDGLLRVARKQNVVPKIMHIHNSAEYWSRSGSLVHTDPLGRRDVKIPPEVRIYAVGGAQHSWGDDLAPTKLDKGQLLTNPTDYRPLLRGLLVALEQWVKYGVEPPKSRYPRIDQGTLVDWPLKKSGWHPLPEVQYPTVIQQPESLDYGPEFYRKGIISRHPPVPGRAYRVLVPAVGDDNNELGMLLTPAVAVPLATFTGWNLRGKEIGASDELLKLAGSWIPFSRTKNERVAAGDERPSIQERYRDFDDYLAKFESAARSLIRERFLLEEELPLLMSRAHKNRPQFEP